jgi:hypothetical protein
MRRVKLLVAGAVLAGAALLGPAIPAHALDCEPGVFATICSATIGTLCQVTKENPCHP